MKEHNLTRKESKRLDRAIVAKIHSDRHSTCIIIHEFILFLSTIGNNAADYERHKDMDTPTAMGIRRRALGRHD